MAEVLVEFTDFVAGPDGSRYLARACGAEADAHGRWHGWLEFIDPISGGHLRSERETTQPNRTDTLYWATGLTAVYLEGALRRALEAGAGTRAALEPAFVEPADAPAPAPPLAPPPAAHSILNPFSVYRKGEALLRQQLAAFSVWHLVNIVRAHGLSEASAGALNAMAASDLIEIIVRGVRARTGERIAH